MFRQRITLIVFFAVALLAPGPSASLAQPVASPAAVVSETSSGSMLFVENAGQWPPSTGSGQAPRFQVWGSPLGVGTTWLAEDAIWITVLGRGTEDGGTEVGGSESQRSAPQFDPTSDLRPLIAVKLTFPGSNPNVRIEPFNPLATTVSYFIGNDPAQWQPAVPVWGGVRYVDLYPGVDLEISGEGGRMAQRLLARPEAVPGAVRVRVDGAELVDVSGRTLRLATTAGDLALPLPTADFSLAVVGNTKGGHMSTWNVAPDRGLAAEASLASGQTLAPSADLADLLYGTFLGGSGDEWGYTVVADETGSAYVAGSTFSSDFPTTAGAFDLSYNGGSSYGGDAFVAKLDPTGNGLEYATFLGGSNEDWGYGMAVDEAGNAYVTGRTNSSDFPTTAGAFDESFNGGDQDVFVAKLNPTGSGLAYATFLGGSNEDRGVAIAVDEANSAYVTGLTYSDNFPTTPGAFDPSFNFTYDAFVVKLNPEGGGLTYATFLGGSGGDIGLGIALDGTNSALVTGETGSSDFPTTPGAFDTTFNAGAYVDAFVVKLNPAGSEPIYATYLGGRRGDVGYAIVADGAGSAYVTGSTSSNDFPATPGAFDPSFNGDIDAFLVKLNTEGSGLAYATYVGGSGSDGGNAIAEDGAGNTFVAGYTRSGNFPTTPGAFDTSLSGDVDGFVIKLNPAGSGLAHGTFLGGSGDDEATAIAVDGTGDAYVAGYTGSGDFPTTPGTFDPDSNGGSDAFVTKLYLEATSPRLVWLPAIFRNR